MASSSVNETLSLLKVFDQLGFQEIKKILVLDVGASGGIEPHWSSLGNKLSAIGFDPLVSEVKRLNETNTNSNVCYEEGFVTYNRLDQHFPHTLRDDPVASVNNSSYERTSCVRATKAKQYDYVQQHFNAGQSVVYSDKYFQLDDYVQDHKIEVVDFIKIDTDGHDFPVLLGAEKIIGTKGVLGLSVECQFHGSTHAYANTFSNIDQFLRAKGFTLFNLDVWKYSKAALPAPFVYDIYAQTQSGPAQWAEAVYFRDLADQSYERKFDFPITKDKALKLACLYELFGLNDCAAEILLETHERFGFSPHLQEMLNTLTPSLKGRKVSYESYIQKFDKNPDLWFPKTSLLKAKIRKLESVLNALPGLKQLKIVKPLKKLVKWIRNR
ncbi:FkbM family methyltransferase [Candidatus Finniella inopinata]|uniref:FkbM family methyltransferase n=1 Tax=Candidatus Finniella inopinata TaxID=1696036 RepID=A0A4Q7DEJ2_9PROT|nr:FkbM family methyltransferase [Candidatus Finniella inopinata]RZI45131.1 FkbM family methyltransferase [Candidatus Finniella inopinata]